MKYGPPAVKSKSYNIMLEILETKSNKKLIDEYKQDISQCLSKLEPILNINPTMIDLQPEIQWFMRPFLLDFLIELHSSFKLQPSTLFLCLNIIDRYCCKRIVFKRHYQLVGCSALWIASKYEDKKSRVPTLKELTIMCRNAYDEEMFIQMEMHILSTLDWNLSHPCLENCLQLSIHNMNFDDSNPINNSKISAITAIGRFLCELSMYDKVFLSFPTSLIAITANLLACNMVQLNNASDYLKLLMNLNLKNKSTGNKNSNPNKVNNENDDFNPERENIHPQVIGPFLSGLDELALLSIKKLTLYFIIQLTQVTEVLSKKYEKLRVIQVIHNFHNRFNYIIQLVNENHSKILLDNITENLIEIAEILINFPKENNNTFHNINTNPDLHLEKSPMMVINDTYHNISQPVTPPSATSQYSVFSNKRSSANTTPTYSASSIYNSGSSLIRTKSKISKHKGGHSSTSNFLEYSPCNNSSTNLLTLNKMRLNSNISTSSISDNWSSPVI